jgi:alanine dehydrogenase
MMERKVTGVAYETITDKRGTLPLLTPMSEVAGRMSVQVGATYLEKMNGGRGILLGGVPGVPAANVVIIGGGVVGTEAAKMAVGLGAHVTIIDKNLDRLRELDDIFLSKVQTLASSRYAIEEAISHADLVIGAVLIPGAAAPKLVTRDMLKLIPNGAVLLTWRLIRAAVLKRRTRRRTRTRLITKKAFCITAWRICRARFRELRRLR